MNREELDLYIEKYLISKRSINHKILNATSIQHGKLKFIKNELIKYTNTNTNNLQESLYIYYYNIIQQPICKKCGKKVNFIKFSQGYRQYCSVACSVSSEETKNKIKQTNLKNNGVEYPMQSKEVQNKVKQTMLNRYGVENPSQSEKIKQKKIDTCMKNYGVDNPWKSNKIQNKVKQTMMNRYGVEYPSQDPTIHQKQLSSFGQSQKIKTINKNLHYQSIPELNFIHYCKSNNIDIWDGPSIEYTLENKKHIYHIDFETVDLLIEIKSSHGWYHKDLKSGKIKAKNNAARLYADTIGKEFKFLLDKY